MLPLGLIAFGQFGDNVSNPESVNQGLIGPNHFAGSPALHWFDEDGITVDLGQDHDVFAPTA